METVGPIFSIFVISLLPPKHRGRVPSSSSRCWSIPFSVDGCVAPRLSFSEPVAPSIERTPHLLSTHLFYPHLCLPTALHSISIFSSNMVLPVFRPPTREEMHAVFHMCRNNQWRSVLNCIRSNPVIPTTSMIMDNHIATTILHQAITSKGDTKERSKVILEILDVAPKAAAIKNGYGSLPLHVIAQRNTKMDAPTKELLITELVNAHRPALVEQGGVGKRTPLHIIFTGTYVP
jgi:hypothetical protein